jgi:rRNA maturation endonuclease Nob1
MNSDLVKCYRCKAEFKPRKEWRERCPRCGTEWWMTPSLIERIESAWWGFIRPW